MAQINFNDFLATQSQTQSTATEGKSKGSGVGFFNLKNDKDFAIVRFMHDDTDSFDIVAGHRMTVNDKLRLVNCIRSAHEPVDNCPLCRAGKKLEYRLYIHLIEYVRNDEGKMVPVPRVWERSASYVNTLTNLMKEYGPLSDNIFKITRNGEKGSKSTTYDIMYGNPKVYTPELYPRRDNAFEGYKAVGNMVLDYDYAKLSELVGTSTTAVMEEATPKMAYQPQPIAPSTYTTTPAMTSPAYQAPASYVEAQAQMAEVSAPPTYAVPQPQMQHSPSTIPSPEAGIARPTRRYYQ